MTLQLTMLVIAMSLACAFQPSLPSSASSSLHHSSHRRTILTIHAKPSKKTKSKTTGTGGFGSSPKSKSSSSPADPSKVRSVSGYTGSGTKVLADAANNFDRLRKLHGKDATTDVYVRSPLNDETVFWFVGKVIRHVSREEDSNDPENDEDIEGRVYPTEAEAILSQKRLILEYAKNQLRPQNLGGPYSKALELWMAP